ncbi:cell division cycle-associated protein 2 [Chanos chanos]|uniref:Cell division cycle-associated protein 2 n=1 Tax=Chanos chanos TaxID=29144 RepID=A0A6J2WTS6_CHACN|nr:cell division cycle-associated protein 2-like [Chanos chanos]
MDSEMKDRPSQSVTAGAQNHEGEPVLDFSQLTPSQFGISSNSFSAVSSHKDKSRVAQLKARRRSTIGVRGSPETNSLICYIAKQRMKTPTRSPQRPQASPFLPRYDSLKQKMAAFQHLIEEEQGENLKPAVTLRKASEAGSKNGTLGKECPSDAEGKENRLTPEYQPSVTPPPSKKRCRAPLGGGDKEINEASRPVPACTSPKEPRERTTEFLSPKPPQDLGWKTQNQLLSLPMLSHVEVNRTDGAEGSSVCKKKRVRFGVPLSPEFFDKTLPPSTPLQKGATPKCPMSSGGSKLRSLLKTPQRNDPPLPQPDFSSPPSNGASPTLAPRSTRNVEPYGEKEDKISFLIMEEEFDNPPEDGKDLVEASECPEESVFTELQPFDMDSAFHEDPAAATHTEPEVDFTSNLDPAPELEPESIPVAEPPHSRSRKRKQPTEMVPETRRSTRSAALSASGKMKKTSSVKRGFGSKAVDRSLYGKRDYASKNPLLSPIPETLLSASLPNTPEQASTVTEVVIGTASPIIPHSEAGHSDATARLVSAAAMWCRRFGPGANEKAQSETSASESEPIRGGAEIDLSLSQSHITVASTDAVVDTTTQGACMGPARSRTKSPKRKNSSEKPTCPRRRSGKTSGRREAELHVDSSGESEGSETDHSKSGKKIKQKHDGAETETVSSDVTRASHSDTPSQLKLETTHASVRLETTQEKDLESPVSPDVDQRNSFRVAPRISAHSSEPEQDQGSARQAKEATPGKSRHRQASGSTRRRRSSSLKTSVVEEKHEEEGEQVERVINGEIPEENTHEVSSASVNCQGREEDDGKSIVVGRDGARNDLAPWQQEDFCIDSVLKAAPKSRGSVRRSLRNRKNLDDRDSGLAWVDRTSPDVNDASRRRTRGRCSMTQVPKPLQPPLFEEPDLGKR